MKTVPENIRKLLLISTLFIGFITLASLLYGRIALGVFTLRYIFPANFFVGSFIILIGLFVVILPVRLTLRNSKIIDHTSYPTIFMERREQKREAAYVIMYLGICVVVIAALVQLLLHLLFRITNNLH